MNIDTFRPHELTGAQLRAVASLASSGFGTSPTIEQDTKNHIEAADIIQLAMIDENPVGFAMYREYLWR